MPSTKLPTHDDGAQGLLDFFTHYDPADAFRFIAYLRDNWQSRRTVGKAIGLLALELVHREQARDDRLTFEQARYQAAEHLGYTGTNRTNFFKLVADGLAAQRLPDDEPLPARRGRHVGKAANNT